MRIVVIALLGLLLGCSTKPSINESIEVPLVNEMIKLEGGTFEMGFDPKKGGYEDEHPHLVTLNPFYISQYEVSQFQYEQVMGSNPSHFKGINLPVEMVTFYDALLFCNALSKSEGLPSTY